MKDEIVSKEFMTAPNRTGVIATNNLLKNAEVLFTQIEAPEDLAFDNQGYLYTGDKNGVIWKIDVNTRKIQKFARTMGRVLGKISIKFCFPLN